MNICRKCVRWHECMQFRYENIQKNFMEEVTRKPNSDGELVIYVQKCSKFVKFKPFKGPIFK